MSESWKIKACEEIDADVKRKIDDYLCYMYQAVRVGKAAKNLVNLLGMQVTPEINPINNSVDFWSWGSPDQHKLVHELSKKFHVKFTKSFDKRMGTIDYEGKWNDVTIRVFNCKEVPKCKIVPKKEMKEVVTYEIKCGE